MASAAIQSLFDLVRIRSRAAFVLGLPACIGFSALFFWVPELDLATSRIFFDAGRTNDGALIGFWLGDSALLRLSFLAVDVISRAVLFGLLCLLIFRIFRRHSKVLSTAVVTLSLVLGPVVVVNSIFKEHWDRARPRELQDFGGSKQFTPAWVKSNQCDRNCAFTSGHAAAGFSFVALYFVARSALWFWLSLVCGGLIGWTRVVVGAHFLSDVVFSFFLVYLISATVAWILVTIAPTAAKGIRI